MPAYDRGAAKLTIEWWLLWMILIGLAVVLLGILGVVIGIIIYASQIAHSVSGLHTFLKTASLAAETLLPCWEAAC